MRRDGSYARHDPGRPPPNPVIQPVLVGHIKPLPPRSRYPCAQIFFSHFYLRRRRHSPPAGWALSVFFCDFRNLFLSTQNAHHSLMRSLDLGFRLNPLEETLDDVRFCHDEASPSVVFILDIRASDPEEKWFPVGDDQPSPVFGNDFLRKWSVGCQL